MLRLILATVHVYKKCKEQGFGYIGSESEFNFGLTFRSWKVDFGSVVVGPGISLNKKINYDVLN